MKCIWLVLLFLPSLLAIGRPSLEDLNTQIRSLEKTLLDAQEKHTVYVKQLEQLEEQSGQLNFHYQKTLHAVGLQQQILHRLNNTLLASQKEFQIQQKNLSLQIKAAYLVDQAELMKLLLHPSEFEQLNRFLQYYRFINAERLERMQALHRLIVRLKQQQTALALHTKQLKHLEARQKKEQTKLQSLKKNRQKVVVFLKQDIQTHHAQLAHLLNNRRRFEKTLRELKEQPMFNQTLPPISSGRLPVVGHILAHFGSAVDHSALKWDGLLIAAAEDTPVHAIAPGRVVFAKWLAGYGLLLIINHGHGYMSLYGRNQTLYKKVGEVVKAGEIVATVGQSGGFTTPALYFAIRHNAKPLDPLRWHHEKM